MCKNVEEIKEILSNEESNYIFLSADNEKEVVKMIANTNARNTCMMLDGLLKTLLEEEEGQLIVKIVLESRGLKYERE